MRGQVDRYGVGGEEVVVAGIAWSHHHQHLFRLGCQLRRRLQLLVVSWISSRLKDLHQCQSLWRIGLLQYLTVWESLGHLRSNCQYNSTRTGRLQSQAREDSSFFVHPQGSCFRGLPQLLLVSGLGIFDECPGCKQHTLAVGCQTIVQHNPRCTCCTRLEIVLEF